MDNPDKTPTPPAASVRPSLEAFHTRARANEGIEVPLFLPDGTATDHRIRIRSTDSDAFRAAEAAGREHMIDVMANKEQLAKFDHEAERLKLVASLVISWTFDRPCTPENVIAFLREAPQIADSIDRVSANRRNFFKGSSPSSSATQEPSSS